MMHRRTLIAAGLAALAAPATAARIPYRLSGSGARISFTFSLSGAPVSGTLPVNRADLSIDPQNLTASTADVTADVRRAETGLIFATQALTSTSVLDAERFPLARFRSTRVILGPGGRISEGAAIEGLLTLREVTQTVRFDAGLFRPPGSAPEDLGTLIVSMTGRIDRHAFGASGYADLVAPMVDIDIRAEISAQA